MAKSKYESHIKPFFDDIFFWRSHDWELVAIAAELGVAESTFFKYKKEYAELSEILKKAEKSKPRYIAIKAEAALRDKLQDREVEEVHQEQWVDKNGVVSKKHIKKIKKIIPADTTAIIFALKNTDSERWNDRSQVETNQKQQNRLLEAQADAAVAKAKILADSADKLSGNIKNNELLKALVEVPIVEKEEGDSL